MRRFALAVALVAAALLAATPVAPAAPAEAGRAPDPTPLVVVSFDGFRWDYPEHTDTPALDRLARDGVRAERLIPVFPSKTFPAHYSLATGLYPGHHGIVSNNMRDPRWPEPFGLGDREQVQSERWWGGEPIWATARRGGLGSAVYFWPGSEAPVDGVRPERWFPYDESVPFEARVRQALEWLSMPSGQAPSLVMLYFDQPNSAGHGYGPLAKETLEQVRRVDGVLGQLLEGLASRQIQANVIVVSDHGMAANDASRLIFLDDFVDLEPDELFEFGALVQIYPGPGRRDAIERALHAAHPHLRVWRREQIPARLHTAESPRLAPIVVSPDSGWEIVPDRSFDEPIPGDHGQDPLHPDMHGIFYAAGPDLVQGVVLPAIEQVDVYPFMTRLLGLEPAANDGDAARTAGLVR